jgi:hypothetical protein
MSRQYASKQPYNFNNHVENIAIVGASGNMGSHITQALLSSKKHVVTAITRTRAKERPVFPKGVVVREYSYEDYSSQVAALQGQDVLVILMSVSVPADTQNSLIKAAGDAGVAWILPSEWAGDPREIQLGKDIFVGPQKQAVRDFIAAVGKSSWIGMVANFWYEFSLAGSPARFGFDLVNRAVTFYDRGAEAINVSTYAQCANAVANLLCLKILPEDESDGSTTLSHLKNTFVYISSFAISQKDIFASVLRVTETTREDWKITYQDCEERYKNGLARFEKGSKDGFEEAMYARMFYPGGEGNYEKKGLLHNTVLGLPVEDLDEATNRSVVLAETNGIPY